jgi:MFS family permease
MNWTDCTSAWLRQDTPSLPTDIAKLQAMFEATRRREARGLLVRDWLEAGTGFMVAAAFIFFWWFLRLPDWPMALAVALVLGVSALFVRERIRARRGRLGAAAPLLAKVEADLAELRHQRRLLLSLQVWYLGPLFAALSLVFLALWLFLRTNLPEAQLGMIPKLMVIYASLMVVVAIINRKVVRRRIEPRIAELEALLAALRPAA